MEHVSICIKHKITTTKIDTHTITTDTQLQQHKNTTTRKNKHTIALNKMEWIGCELLNIETDSQDGN